MINRYGFIVNDIGNFIFGPAEVTVYGFCKSRKQKFVMSFTILYNRRQEKDMTFQKACLWYIIKSVWT